MKIKIFPQGGAQDNVVEVDGFTLLDFLNLYRDPEFSNEAANKRYVDKLPTTYDVSKIVGDTIPKQRLVGGVGGDLIGFNGTDLFLKSMGITAGSYNKVTVDAKGRVTAAHTDTGGTQQLSFNSITNKPTTAGGYIADVSPYAIKTNGTNSDISLTGTLMVNTQPTVDTHAATQQYLQTKMANMSAGAKIGDLKISTPSIAGTRFMRANGAVLDKTAYAALYAVIGDTFSSGGGAGGTTGYVAQPWRQQYAFNTVNNSTSGAWTAGGNLLAALWWSQAAVTKNRIYMFGGVVANSTYTPNIYTAPLNADGSIGTWATAGTIPSACCGHTVIMTKNKLYLIGGALSPSQFSPNSYWAPINADGTIGAFTAGTSLPAGVCGASVVVTTNRIYLMGGLDAAGYSKKVYTATIDDDGVIGAWTSAADMPGVLNGSQAVITKNRVYVLGGAVTSTTHTSAVYTAPINADGTLGAWTTGTSLPSAVAFAQAVMTNNRVYLIGGAASSSGALTTVYTTPINADGTLGTWTTSTALPSGMAYGQAVVTNSRMIMIGGYNPSGTALTTTTSYTFSGGTNDYVVTVAGNIFNPTTSFKLPDYSNLTNGILEYFICAAN